MRSQLFKEKGKWIELKEFSPDKLKQKINEIESCKESIIKTQVTFRVELETLKKSSFFNIQNLIGIFTFIKGNQKLQKLIDEKLDPALEQKKAELEELERYCAKLMPG